MLLIDSLDHGLSAENYFHSPIYTTLQKQGEYCEDANEFHACNSTLSFLIIFFKRGLLRNRTKVEYLIYPSSRGSPALLREVLIFILAIITYSFHNLAYTLSPLPPSLTHLNTRTNPTASNLVQFTLLPPINTTLLLQRITSIRHTRPERK